MHAEQTLFDTLNADYLAVHKTKEDLFWDTYMAISDDHAGFARAEEAYKDFISNPSRLAQVRAALARLKAAPESADKGALQQGLQGWLALFECNIVDSDEARLLMGEMIAQESALFSKRSQLVMHHTNEAGVREEATLSMLSTNLGTNPNEAARLSGVLDERCAEIGRDPSEIRRSAQLRFDGADPAAFADYCRQYIDRGFTEIVAYVSGPDAPRLAGTVAERVLPELR